MCNHKQNYTEAEDVYFWAVVNFAFFNLGRHVGEGSSVTAQVVDLLLNCEAEICDFDIAFFVEKDVLKLQIPMAHSIALHVLHYFEHLVSEKSPDIFTHRLVRLTHIKQKVTINKLHNQED